MVPATALFGMMALAKLAVPGDASVAELTIYYQAICPHSMQLFREQYLPLARELSNSPGLSDMDLLGVVLVPYGFATINMTADGR